MQSIQRSAQIDGWTVNIESPSAAIESVTAAARRLEGFTCFTLNLDHLVKLRRLQEFRLAYYAARFVTADGTPIVRMARRQWPELKKTTGSDLLVPLCKAAAEHDLPVYLFGSSNDVLRETTRRLQVATRNRLHISGFEAPPQNFDVNASWADESIDRITTSGARLCFVMLGAPKQELFATRAVKRGAKIGFICVGAAADFIAGREIRAPHFLQTIGLEWLWRLAHNPRRLAMRYARCARLLILLELNYRTSRKAAKRFRKNFARDR